MTLRIGLLNNYSMKKALDRHQCGEYPGQHLWGAVPARVDTHWFVPSGMFDWASWGSGFRSRIRSVLLRLIGDPIQQVRCLIRRDLDVYYAADQWTGALIGLLRRLRVVRTPYVVLVHHPPSSRWNAFCLRGADRFAVLSPLVADGLRSRRVANAEAVTVMPWGPEMNWPGYRVSENRVFDFVAVGRTNRDYAPLVKAAKTFRLSGVVMDGNSQVEFRQGVVVDEKPGIAEYRAVARSIASSKAVVIPLADSGKLSGLTEMADALALGTPILMTRSPINPWDVDVMRIGLLFESNDPDEIGRAILRAPSLATNFPDAAKRLNTDEYSDALRALIERAISANRR